MWNPRGGELFYLNRGRMMVVEVETEGGLILGKPRLLFERQPLFELYDVTPDGPRFVMLEEMEHDLPPTQLNLVLNWGEELRRLAPAGE